MAQIRPSLHMQYHSMASQRMASHVRSRLRVGTLTVHVPTRVKHYLFEAKPARDMKHVHHEDAPVAPEGLLAENNGAADADFCLTSSGSH
eukprot:5532496-Pyramimonas_sp.AAC.1